MKSLPDRPDLDQLRTQAKELKRALAEGSEEARQRVLANHPKFAGRAAERIEGFQFGLRDAQVILAREHGFESWKAMLEELEGDAVARWAGEWSITSRAFKEAMAAGQSWCGPDHLLLALLDPPQPTVVSEALNELGIFHADVVARLKKMSRRRRKKGSTTNPAFQHVVGMAQGIAIGMGATRMTDEHVVLALTYGDLSGQMRLLTVDVDPDDLVAALRARKVAVPRTAPRIADRLMGPFGPWVYFPVEDFPAVTRELAQIHPPGSILWGTNRSKWKRGYWYVHGEDEIDMEEIVKRAVRDPALVEVLSPEEGSAVESALAPRRYRDRPEL